MGSLASHVMGYYMLNVCVCVVVSSHNASCQLLQWCSWPGVLTNVVCCVWCMCVVDAAWVRLEGSTTEGERKGEGEGCLLYTSDAADE